MNKKEQELKVLKTICQLFTLSEEAKWQYLNSARSLAPFVINECGDKTNEPLEFFCNAAYEFTDRFRDKDDRAFYELVRDLSTLLRTAIEIKMFFLWQDPQTRVVSGSADLLWHVIRRLAAQVLEYRGWSVGVPDIPLHKLTWAGTLVEE